MLPALVRWLGLAKHAAAERQREHADELVARSEALNVGHKRLQQIRADGRVSPEALKILHARYEYRAGRLPRHKPDGSEADMVAAEIRMELIAAEREYIYKELQEGRITDEARRRIERELDLEEASVACKKEGGEEPPL
jgi:CPA1 family monovalent cation:H+ antiporter